ncbi:MAG: RNA 2',3'-cyclic phosphodiesterase [bacterium]
MIIRSFISIELSKTIKSNLIKIQNFLKTSNSDVKWEKQENHHLTLLFLGNIDESQLKQIIPTLNNAMKNFPSFKIKLENINILPNLQDPRVIWLGVSNEKEKIIYLHNLIAKELKNIGVKTEKRKFSPHITLGRIKSNVKINKLITLIRNIKTSNISNIDDFKVKQISLMKSILMPKGSIYIPLENFNLEGKNA